MTGRRSATKRVGRLVAPIMVTVALAIAFALPWLVESYTLGRISSLLYLGVGVLSVNLLTGLSGQISIGHAAFLGIGAYSVVILVSDFGWPYAAASVVGVLAAAVAGLVVALPSLRLRGLYVALTSLGLALIFPSLLRAASGITGGSAGKTLLEPLPIPLWSGLDQQQWTYLVLLVLSVVVLVVVHNLKASRIGRAMAAVRDHDVVAESFGVSPAVTKVTTFVISAGIAGLAGAMFAMQRQFVSPIDFNLVMSIDLLVGMAISGPTSVFGALAGGGFLEYAPTVAEGVGIDPILTPVVYGGILIAFVLFFREGVAGIAHRIRRRLAPTQSEPAPSREEPGARSVKPAVEEQTT